MSDSTAADFAQQIGERIRRLRTERGVSLSALASGAGVGKATLSGLEDGSRGNPTVETLYAIAGHLGVPIGALLPEPPQPGGAPLAALHGAAVSASLLETFSDADVATELFSLRIRPGHKQQSPAHPPGTIEYLTVFAGTARVGPPDALLIVPPGGHVSWRADVSHTYSAVGVEDVRASLLIRTPRTPGTPPANSSDASASE
ncbi:MAG: transcriptional regulator [Catenulispora sp. 13_1_20CM_3_70_7]|nr:helix-turn-helix domain-containing protein [Catenulisporales bacterium]OLE26342.1 MAG: transcriptional regulator [Catenulispora sp. 13_1_20CM_3_70_7]